MKISLPAVMAATALTWPVAVLLGIIAIEYALAASRY
jgi:hypothetical protein